MIREESKEKPQKFATPVCGERYPQIKEIIDIDEARERIFEEQTGYSLEEWDNIDNEEDIDEIDPDDYSGYFVRKSGLVEVNASQVIYYVKLEDSEHGDDDYICESLDEVDADIHDWTWDIAEEGDKKTVCVTIYAVPREFERIRDGDKKQKALNKLDDPIIFRHSITTRGT